jgi:putative oligomerization/nucleic acid binding protein
VNIIAQRRLERRLLEQGQAAEAEVLGKHRYMMRYGDQAGGGRLFRWQLLLRVTPAGQPAFEVEYSQWLPPDYEPVVGQTFDVLYDPADQTKVVVDPRAASPLTKAMNVMNSAGGSEEEQRRATQEFMALTNPGVAKVLQEYQEVAAATPLPGDLKPDVASRIEQLDRLMKAGLISDEQYQAKKQKLLGQL